MECDQLHRHPFGAGDYDMDTAAEPEYNPFAQEPERENSPDQVSSPTVLRKTNEAVRLPWTNDSWLSIPVPENPNVTEDFTERGSDSHDSSNAPTVSSVSTRLPPGEQSIGITDANPYARPSSVASDAETVSSAPTRLPPGEWPIWMQGVNPPDRTDSGSDTTLSAPPDNEDARAVAIGEEATETSDVSVTETIDADGDADGLTRAKERPWCKAYVSPNSEEVVISPVSPPTPPAPTAAEYATAEASQPPHHPATSTSKPSPQSCEQGERAPEPQAGLETTSKRAHTSCVSQPHERNTTATINAYGDAGGLIRAEEWPWCKASESPKSEEDVISLVSPPTPPEEFAEAPSKFDIAVMLIQSLIDRMIRQTNATMSTPPKRSRTAFAE